MTTVTVILHKPCQYLQTGAVTATLITTLTYLSQTLAKVLFKNNPNIRSSKDARISDHWSPGTMNYFAMEPNYSDCYVYTQHRQFTGTEHKVPIISQVHSSFQNFGFSVWKSYVTILMSRIGETTPWFLGNLSTPVKAAIIVQPIGKVAKCKINNFSVI